MGANSRLTFAAPLDPDAPEAAIALLRCWARGEQPTDEIRSALPDVIVHRPRGLVGNTGWLLNGGRIEDGSPVMLATFGAGLHLWATIELHGDAEVESLLAWLLTITSPHYLGTVATLTFTESTDLSWLYRLERIDGQRVLLDWLVERRRDDDPGLEVRERRQRSMHDLQALLTPR